MNDTLKLKGTYRLIHSRGGKVLSDELVDNLVTNAGKAQLALLCGDSSATPFTYIAVGTSSTAVAVTDTTLGAEITDSGLQRASATISRTTTTVTNDTYQATKTFSVTGTKTVQEIGIFNASSGGTLLSHALSGAKSVESGDELTATYTLKFS